MWFKQELGKAVCKISINMLASDVMCCQHLLITFCYKCSSLR